MAKKLEKRRRIVTIPGMKFVLIDKVIRIEPGSEIEAVKSVSLAEEYLADHFPTFPVLPGVLLLEGLIESAAWLVRLTQDFSKSMVLLEHAGNVKYKSFAAPGSQLKYFVKARTIEENVSGFSGKGTCGADTIVEARFSLRHFNLADEDAKMAAVDDRIVQSLKQRWKLLRP